MNMSDVLNPKIQPLVAAGEPEKKGWLFKWTNYLKGYQRRWFVLSNGLLSYYRNQAEMAHTCRGTISLLGALIHTADSCTFVISNGGTQTFHIKAHDEVERQSWVTALELAKAKAIRAQESDDEEDHAHAVGVMLGGGEREGEEAASLARELSARFHDLRTCSELVARHGAALQRSLVDLEIPPSDTTNQVTERATLFRISCNAMINACSEFMSAAAASNRRVMRSIQQEREQAARIQHAIDQANTKLLDNGVENTDHGDMSHIGGAGAADSPGDDDEHEFFDAVDEAGPALPDTTSFVMRVPVNRKNKLKAGESSEESEGETETQQVIFVEDKERTDNATGALDPDGAATKQQDDKDEDSIKVWPHVSEVRCSMVDGHPRRTSVPEKPACPLNLWSIMKNCIGKELSKIPIPVNFSEPLSMLQRLTEDYEYSDILDRAAKLSDPARQLAYVAAFTVSSYATSAYRTNKPFNPLLGETYECDRMADLGWRAISEQVSHHPPMVAQFCEGHAGWQCWQEFSMSTKFRGKYLQVVPMGIASAKFLKSGNTYTWRKVTTTVHNIIVGKLWVDNHGEMEIAGEAGAAAGYRAHLKYPPYGYFSRDARRKVTGVISDPNGVPRYVLQGQWDSCVEVAPVTSASADNAVCRTGKFAPIWLRVPAPPDSDRCYNFTILAAQLNEPESGVAPTDSRLRPDQRLMEQGLWDEANVEKLRLEEKQRAARREHDALSERAAAEGSEPPAQHTPVWFERQSGRRLRHVYNNQYWECKQRQDWAKCPAIF